MTSLRDGLRAWEGAAAGNATISADALLEQITLYRKRLEEEGMASKEQVADVAALVVPKVLDPNEGGYCGREPLALRLARTGGPEVHLLSFLRVFGEAQRRAGVMDDAEEIAVLRDTVLRHASQGPLAVSGLVKHLRETAAMSEDDDWWKAVGAAAPEGHHTEMSAVEISEFLRPWLHDFIAVTIERREAIVSFCEVTGVTAPEARAALVAEQWRVEVAMERHFSPSQASASTAVVICPEDDDENCCPICMEDYQEWKKRRQTAQCCGQEICSHCSRELALCPFCRQQWGILRRPVGTWVSWLRPHPRTTNGWEQAAAPLVAGLGQLGAALHEGAGKLLEDVRAQGVRRTATSVGQSFLRRLNSQVQPLAVSTSSPSN
mmetsp:Transcript_10975/g.23530  ORF Transcript_10975/g.23530 Transcript_10975/m.23530 type:complete len:378 (+) Transcript_10975:23-1156(+)